jgi:hypothetical protein
MEECRICFDEDSIQNFITPCLCRGTNKYVHEECLQIWRIMAENPENVTTCPSCQFKYIIELKNKGLCQCFKKYSKNISVKINHIFIFNLIYLSVISSIIFFVNNFNIVILNANNKVNDILDISSYDIYIFHISNIIILISYMCCFLFDILTTLNKTQIIMMFKKMYFFAYLVISITLIYVSFISILPGFLACTFFIHSLSKDYIHLLSSNEILKDYKIISLSDIEIQNDHNFINII